MKRTSIFVCLLCLAPLVHAAGRDLSPPQAPQIPAGYADSYGRLGFFAGAGGTVEAVQLANGSPAWSSELGRWPLASTHAWLAVAAPGQAGLKVRFLAPQDGRLLAETAPLEIPSAALVNASAAGDEQGVYGGSRNGSLQLTAWALAPHRGRQRGPKPGWLRLRWQFKEVFISGIAPPQRGKQAEGLLFLDPVTGAVAKAAKGQTESPPSTVAALPKGWKPPKELGLTVLDYVADISQDGRFVLLHWNRGGKDFQRLIGLGSQKNGLEVDIPVSAGIIRPPLAVLEKRLLYTLEGPGESTADGSTLFKRDLVAWDLTEGKLAWRHALPARLLPPPVAGSW